MKKQLFSISAVVAAVIMASCNNGSDTSSNTSTTDSTNTMTTTTTGTDTGMGKNKMGTDTSMTNRMDTSTSGKMATTGATTANNVSASDKKFINEAAIGGMMEVEAGQLAASNATNDRVKAFG